MPTATHCQSAKLVTETVAVRVLSEPLFGRSHSLHRRHGCEAHAWHLKRANSNLPVMDSENNCTAEAGVEIGVLVERCSLLLSGQMVEAEEIMMIITFNMLDR